MLYSTGHSGIPGIGQRSLFSASEIIIILYYRGFRNPVASRVHQLKVTLLFLLFQCEKCNLHFRHKSQLRLHLRQKHGAITNTKIQYRMSTAEMPTDLTKAC